MALSIDQQLVMGGKIFREQKKEQEGGVITRP